MFPGNINHVPRDVAAVSNTNYLRISRDTCRTNHDRVFWIFGSDMTIINVKNNRFIITCKGPWFMTHIKRQN